MRTPASQDQDRDAGSKAQEEADVRTNRLRSRHPATPVVEKPRHHVNRAVVRLPSPSQKPEPDLHYYIVKDLSSATSSKPAGELWPGGGLPFPASPAATLAVVGSHHTVRPAAGAVRVAEFAGIWIAGAEQV